MLKKRVHIYISIPNGKMILKNTFFRIIQYEKLENNSM